MRATGCVLGMALVAVGGCRGGLGPDLDHEAIGTFSVQLDATGDVALTLDDISGAITIRGAETATVDIQAERRVRSGSQSDAEAFLELVTVDVSEVGSEIFVHTQMPNHTGERDVLVDYELTIPSYFAVVVQDVNGVIDVSGVDTSVTAQTVNGAVYVRDVVGDVRASTVNGNIDVDVTLLPPNGTVDLSVVNGNIVIDLPASTSAMLDAQVVTGTVTVGDEAPLPTAGPVDRLSITPPWSRWRGPGRNRSRARAWHFE
jgi:hypothetical protein